MNLHEIIPLTNLRKFDVLCMHNRDLHQNRELQQQILSWAAEMLTEARENWGKLHATTIEAVVAEDRKAQAKRRGRARDNKYAPFREYFKTMQHQRFKIYQEVGQKLTANGFVEWFLTNLSEDIKIPYRESNKKNKLIQLAQINNREFKKAFEC